MLIIVDIISILFLYLDPINKNHGSKEDHSKNPAHINFSNGSTSTLYTSDVRVINQSTLRQENQLFDSRSSGKD